MSHSVISDGCILHNSIVMGKEHVKKDVLKSEKRQHNEIYIIDTSESNPDDFQLKF